MPILLIVSSYFTSTWTGHVTTHIKKKKEYKKKGKKKVVFWDTQIRLSLKRLYPNRLASIVSFCGFFELMCTFSTNTLNVLNHFVVLVIIKFAITS